MLCWQEGLHACTIGLVNDNFKGEKVSFRVSRFIDGRLDRDRHVGFTRMGFKGIDKLYLAQNFAHYCDSFFRQSPLKTGVKKEFVAVINQVTMQEIENQVEGNYSDVSLAVDFYLVDTLKGEARLYYRSYTRSIAGAADLTKKHKGNLSQTFLLAFLDLEEYTARQEYTRHYPLKSMEDSLYEENTPLPADTLLPDGVYYSSKQLCQNLPDKDETLLASIDTSKLEAYMYDKDQVRLGTPCFALVKHGVLYICLRKGIYHKASINFAARRLRIIDPYGKKSSLTQTKSKLSYMYGLTGLLADAIINSIHPPDHNLYVDLVNGFIGAGM